MVHFKKAKIYASILIFSNYCLAQSEPVVPVDPVQQAMAPIQSYLSSFKPRPTLKPITNAMASCAGNSSLATVANFWPFSSYFSTSKPR